MCAKSTQLPRQKQHKIVDQDTTSIIQPFLHRLVTVKAADFTIKGTLWRVDPDTEHNPPGLGNLVLSDKTVIKGNHVQAICIESREKAEK